MNVKSISNLRESAASNPESSKFPNQWQLSEQQYQLITDNMADIVCLVSTQGQIKHISPSIKRVLGFNDNELKNSHLSAWVFPEDRNAVKKWFFDMIHTKSEQKIEYRAKHKEKDWVCLETIGIPILSTQQEILDIVLVTRDITEKNQFLQQLQVKDQRYQSLFKHNANSVYSYDLNGYFTSCNSICEKITGYSKEELLKPMNFNDFIVPEKREETLDYFIQCKNGTPQNFRTSILDRQGSLFHLNVTIVPIVVNGEINGVFGIAQDITKQVEIERANEHMAYHDYLTGLPNRNKLNASLPNELTLAAEKNQNIAVLFMDLDRFKVINDTLGHNTGDQLLIEVSKRMTSSLDEKDRVFRQGGDEFIVILHDADRNVATKVCTRILDQLSAPFKIQNYDIFTSTSIGISLFPEDGLTVEALIKHADFAMYQAKKEGKNNFQFYSSFFSESHIHPLKLEMDLHKAIQNEELLLKYQPKVSLKTGKIVGVEALIRWNHPELGIVSPGVFIPIAEETGLILSIGEWALYTACQQNKQWEQKGFSTTVSVNLSARQFTQSNLDETVARILHDTGLNPECLEIEITESMTANTERTIATLQKLKRLGVSISMDDFGTGFSSLKYLQKLPLDKLKIDRSFVRQLPYNPNDETIVKTIISMAHNLNLSVVGEGIETKEQLMFLQQQLCDEGQGYLFTEPVSAKELEMRVFEVQQVVQDQGISQDVHEQKWSAELVRLARKELNETIRLQQGMIFKFKKINGEFIHTLCDGDLLYRLGLMPNCVIGKRLDNFCSKETAQSTHVCYERAWNGEENVTYEIETNGIYYFSVLSPVKRGGEVVEVIGSSMDITDRKNVEKKLMKSEYKYRLIAENMTDLIILFDTNRTGVYASPSHEPVLGYSPEFFEHHSTIQLIHPEDIAYTMEKFEEIIETKAPCKIELRLLHANGKWKLFECTGSPVLGENGAVEHVMAVAKDITEKRRAEEMLWNSKKLSLVGELAAGVAHEIRNPLTSIKGFIQLFQQGLVKEEYFAIILEEFNRIEEIIHEFLSLAKPQKIQLKPVHIPALIKEVVTLVNSEAHLKDAEFIIEMEPEIPLVMCDANQIKQVLINLCKNSMEALDLERKGIIKIIVGTEKPGQLLIRVIDNGVGISEERITRLGEPFYSNKEKGTGLGLMLCFRIIREHKGTITFHSAENQGTTVNLRLPLG